MQGHLSESPIPGGFSGRSYCTQVKQIQISHTLRRKVSALSAKRSTRDKSGGGIKDPLYVTIEADGSDLWRLDPVISMLQQGAVSLVIHQQDHAVSAKDTAW